MKFIIAIFIIAASFNCFAGGTTGAGPDKLNKFENPRNSDLVFYMGKRQSEIKFATVMGGDAEVKIRSLRVEEISDSSVLEGLKRSTQSRKWELIKAPSMVDINKSGN